MIVAEPSVSVSWSSGTTGCGGCVVLVAMMDWLVPVFKGGQVDSERRHILPVKFDLSSRGWHIAMDR